MHFDWSTLALQTVNVFVLMWLLARFLFRPVRAIIEERHAAAGELLEEAAKARAQVEDDAAELQARSGRSSMEAERTMMEARAAGDSERVKLLEQAGATAARMREEAKAAIEIDRLVMERTLRRQACDLAIVIAQRLAARLPAKAATAALLESLTAAVAGMPEAELRDLGTAGPVELITAVPLDSRQQAACQDTFSGLFGQDSPLIFRTDPALLAGVELHTPGMVVRDSWRADLERIAGELKQEAQHEADPAHLV